MKNRDFDKMAIAYDSTYGKGINPEAVPEILKALKSVLEDDRIKLVGYVKEQAEEAIKKAEL